MKDDDFKLIFSMRIGEALGSSICSYSETGGAFLRISGMNISLLIISWLLTAVSYDDIE